MSFCTDTPEEYNKVRLVMATVFRAVMIVSGNPSPGWAAVTAVGYADKLLEELGYVHPDEG